MWNRVLKIPSYKKGWSWECLVPALKFQEKRALMSRSCQRPLLVTGTPAILSFVLQMVASESFQTGVDLKT